MKYEQIKNILLTGKPGVGKTTLLRQVVRGLKTPYGGFYTREIREKGKRVGFQLTTWEGQTGIMSHVRIHSPYRVGKYGVDVSVIDEIGVPAILDALKNKKFVIVDELGRMELFSERFRKVILKAFESPFPILAVVQERAHPFLDQIRQRSDVELIHVTIQNRNKLVGSLKRRLEDLFKHKIEPSH